MNLRPPQDLFHLDGRIVCITGGAGLLAGEFARLLAGAGARLVLLDAARDALEERVALLRESGAQVDGHVVDVSEERQVDEAFALIARRHGRLDVLVNNAATKSPRFMSELEDLPVEDWDHVLAGNLTSMFLCTKAAIPLMRAGGGGSIVNVGSIYGLVAPDPRIYVGTEIRSPAVYSASKGAAVALTKYTAAYHARDQIRCNLVIPGGVEAGQPLVFIGQYSDRVPLGRMARAAEIAPAVLFLASQCSSYITGQALVVDGGLTAW